MRKLIPRRKQGLKVTARIPESILKSNFPDELKKREEKKMQVKLSVWKRI